MKLKMTDLLILICLISSIRSVDNISYLIWACTVIYVVCRVLDWRKGHE
nr:MAG TPA_asm: hypothetical protein [Caudoviricetes sp.]